MNEAQIKTVVEPILQSRLADFGYESVSVQSGEDHDGDPVVFIEVSFDPGQRILSGELMLDVLVSIRARLDDLGEMRFPHVRWRYTSGEYPDDDDQDARLFADSTSDL